MTTIEQQIERWIAPPIRQLSAYHVPPAGGMVKLDAMENPYNWPLEWPVERQQAWMAELQQLSLNRYPDPNATELLQQLRRHYRIDDGLALLPGNGSDEIIQLLALAVAAPGRVVLAPEPGFVMYRMIATLVGMSFCGVPLQSDFSLDRGAMLSAIEARQPALIFLACPNNPTGNLWSKADIEAMIDAAPGLVVIDEAYAPFTAGRTWMGELSRYPNLLLMGTLSKWGVAGLRCGFLVGDPRWIEQLHKLRLPYNINSLTQLTARFALQHASDFEQQALDICAQRQQLYQQLSHYEALHPYPSQANFILVRLLRGEVDVLFNDIKSQGVLVKNLHPQGGLLTQCLRVTVGREAENGAFLRALAYGLAKQQLL
ncbi:histidinol-phosphate transaminase [Ectothiorhodospiraceae bacterium BW-2]|nr:histidinol-phosphate transaminase [Ectothiorhodospiraceae bacterium BW-2]